LSGHDIDRTIVGVFDCVLSLEALEHDPLWRLTVENMIRVLNKPGLLIVTCASYQRPEHGTTRTTPGESPGTTSKNWDHYKNITEDDFVNHLKSIDPDLHVHTWYNKQVFDLYAIVFKSDLPDVLFTVPSAGEIDTILNSTPHLFKYARYPIRAIHSIFGDQLGSWFSRHYWTFLNRTLSSRVRGTRN
jgi:hypothetical protein